MISGKLFTFNVSLTLLTEKKDIPLNILLWIGLSHWIGCKIPSHFQVGGAPKSLSILNISELKSLNTADALAAALM